MTTTQESDMHPLNLGNNSDGDSLHVVQQNLQPPYLGNDSDGEDSHQVVQENLQPPQSETRSERSVPKKKRRLTSGVWKDFRLLEPEPGQPLYCECKKCHKKFLAESKHGTGNLHRHLKICLRKTTTEMGEFIVTSENNVLPKMNSSFCQDKFREMLVHAIIRHDLAFSFVEYEGIRNIFKYLEPQTTNISRNTAKADIKKVYDREMTRLRGELIACPSRICLTSDVWTSIATDGYLSLTAHFVDSNWVLQKKILNFSYFPPPHSGIALAEKITTLATNWGIERKLFSITLDNASANDSCASILKTNLTLMEVLLHDGLLFHVRCCAHILNLIVQDGLKEIDDAVSKIRECVKYVRGSPGRKIKFKECTIQTSLDSKKSLHQDVPTRWNSTYLMLSSAIYYRRAFCHLHLADSNFQSCPTQEEWEKVRKICEFLKVFYDATNSFSGSLYPTSNLYFPEVFFIQLHLSEKCSSHDPYIKKIAQQMFVKFNKYWSEFNLLLAIAVVFDPRYKYRLLELSYGKLYGPDSPQLAKVRNTLVNLFNEYAQASPTTDSSCSRGSNELHSSDSTQHIEQDSIQSKFFEEFEQYKSSEFGGRTQKSQLDLYLEEPTISRTTSVDVLQFWKSQQFKYPDLAKLARDVLCVPVSTVASESAFSLGGRILDQYRSSMTPPIVESLICTRDWLFRGTVLPQLNSNDIVENIMDVDSSTHGTNWTDVDVEFTNSNVV